MENHVQAMKDALTPSVCAYFRSFYYSNTYMDPVDLDQELPKYSCPDREVLLRAQKITSLPGVQRVFSDPITFDLEVINEKNGVLTHSAFQILGTKAIRQDAVMKAIPFPNVASHPDLPEWIFKAGGDRSPKDEMVATLANDQQEKIRFSSYESLLRVKMNERLRKECDIIIPNEYAIPYTNPDNSDVTRSYFILSQKLDILTEGQTIEAVRQKTDEEQVTLAQRMVSIVKKGVADAAFTNFRFTTSGELALIDGEPTGLFIYQKDPEVSRGHSVEKCARVGLFTLKEYAKSHQLHAFAAEVERHYQASLSDYSVTKIILSILCPLIPLVLLIIAAINTRWIGQVVDKVVDKGIEFGQRNALTAQLNPKHFQRQMKAFLLESRPLQAQYDSAVDGVPFVIA